MSLFLKKEDILNASIIFHQSYLNLQVTNLSNGWYIVGINNNSLVELSDIVNLSQFLQSCGDEFVNNYPRLNFLSKIKAISSDDYVKLKRDIYKNVTYSTLQDLRNLVFKNKFYGLSKTIFTKSDCKKIANGKVWIFDMVWNYIVNWGIPTGNISDGKYAVSNYNFELWFDKTPNDYNYVSFDNE